jgi:hypothetical protein
VNITGEACTAYKKAGMPKVTVAKKFDFAEALLGLGSPVSSLGA